MKGVMEVTQSFSVFVTANWPSLYRLAFLLAGSSSDADDALQAVLVRTWDNWEKIQEHGDPLSYVRRSVCNACMDVHRASRRSRRLIQRLDSGREVESWEQKLLDRDVVWRAVRALPPRQRAVVVLRYWTGMSEQEIAVTLGCRPGTVKSQASAAMGTLRRELVELNDMHRRES